VVEAMSSDSSGFCRCICGTSGRRDPLDPRKGWASADIDVLEEVDEPPFQAPQVAGRLSYSISADQPLRGTPIREGEIWWLSTEDKVDAVAFQLFINGFAFTLQGQPEAVVSLSPFTLVRNCKFQSNYPSLNLTDFKIFKVSLFAQGVCYYFGVKGADEREAEEMRARWVFDISRAMRLVTQSIFPPFSITCDPLESVPSTHQRLMAGYLIHHEDDLIASVLYCELHPHIDDQAKVLLYENEACQTPVLELYVTERSICCEKVGINCSCFSVENHQFSSRTIAERKLWLRAISNLKVKLQNHAPTPNAEDLKNYRVAIKEHIGSMKEAAWAPTDPLLQRCLFKPRPAPAALSGLKDSVLQPPPPAGPLPSQQLTMPPPQLAPQAVPATSVPPMLWPTNGGPAPRARTREEEPVHAPSKATLRSQSVDRGAVGRSVQHRVGAAATRAWSQRPASEAGAAAPAG